MNKITLRASARDVAPLGPIWFLRKLSTCRVLLTYTGTWHNKGGLPGRGVAQTNNQKTQKRTKLTAIASLNAVAPASPILFPPKYSPTNVLFSYTGIWHGIGGLPGEGGSPSRKEQDTSKQTSNIFARAFAPSSPMLPPKSPPPRLSTFNVLFTYTGTNKNKGGLPVGGGHTKYHQTQKMKKITLRACARDVSPLGPMLFHSKFNCWSDVFTYTGTCHNKGGLR